MTLTTANLYTGKALTKAVADVISQHKTFEAELHKVACSALYHSIKNHNTTPITTLIAGLGGSVRRNALIAWACAFGECKPTEDGKNVEHVRKDGDLQAAIDKPFWEFKPEAPFSPFDLGAELSKLVARAEKAAKDQRNSLPEEGFRQLRELQAKVKPLEKVA